MNRHLGYLTLAAVFALGTAWPAVAAEAPKSIRIGYAISISGVKAQGASVTTVSGLPCSAHSVSASAMVENVPAAPQWKLGLSWER